MSTSKFSSFVINVSKNVVAKGSKTSGFATPTLYTSPAKDKFNIDSKAITLLGIEETKAVIFIDNGSIDNLIAMCEGAELKNPSRFMIAAGYEIEGTDKNGKQNVRGSRIGNNNVFNATKVWGAIIKNEDDVKEINMKELVEQGLAVRNENADNGKVTYTGTQKVFFHVEPLLTVDDETIESPVNATDGVSKQLFSLIEFAREDVTAEDLEEVVTPENDVTIEDNE